MTRAVPLPAFGPALPVSAPPPPPPARLLLCASARSGSGSGSNSGVQQLQQQLLRQQQLLPSLPLPRPRAGVQRRRGRPPTPPTGVGFDPLRVAPAARSGSSAGGGSGTGGGGGGGGSGTKHGDAGAAGAAARQEQQLRTAAGEPRRAAAGRRQREERERGGRADGHHGDGREDARGRERDHDRNLFGDDHSNDDDDDDDDDDDQERAPEPADDGLVRLQVLGRRVAFPGRYLLYGVPFLWGTFGPAVRVLFAVEPHPVPSLFNTERLLLSCAVYLPILLGELAAVRKRLNAQPRPQGDDDDDDEDVVVAAAAVTASAGSTASTTTSATAPSAENYEDPYLSLKAGLELGAWVFLANVAQVLGLEATSAGRAAFLVQLQTVFIPVMAGMLGINRVGRSTWISSLIAISGVALLSLDKGHGSQSSVLGDGLEVLSAVFFSIYVIRLGGYCNRIPPGPLIAIKISVQAALSTLWAVGAEAWTLTSHPVLHNPDGPATWTAQAIFINVAVIAWTGIMTSAVSGWLQTKGQQFVPASESAVIFATQPLWASATAAVLLGETFGPRGIGGGALIILATIFGSMSDSRKKEQELAALDVDGVSSSSKKTT